MFKKTIALAGTAALMALGLTGCGATLGGGAQPTKPLHPRRLRPPLSRSV